MSLSLGIDLGTTYSSVSFIDVDKAETIDLDAANGSKLLPSVVFYESPDAPPIVGTAAVNASLTSPELVVSHIKRHIGTQYTTEPIHGNRLTPVEVSSEILKTLAENAEQYIGEEVKDVVITVPAYFGDHERKQTEEAAELAGLNLLKIISEPHAAALAYTFETAGDVKTEYVLVYDLGGGTFDVTLLKTADHQDGGEVLIDLEALVKEGKRVGGIDWDEKLFELAAELAPSDVDIRSDPRIATELMLDCEEAKRDLSKTGKAILRPGGVTNQVEITREQFEEATNALLLQTQLLLEQVLTSAKEKDIQTNDITVVLVGGSSRMPKVAELIEDMTGKPPLKYKNPDLLVTTGAAYYAHLMSNEKLALRKVGEKEKTVLKIGTLADMAKNAIGVEITRGDNKYNAEVIPAGAAFGEDFDRTFASAEDGSTSIEIVLYEGPEVENPKESKECEQILACHIHGLPEGRPKGAKVDVILGWNVSGILRGKAIDCQTNKEVAIELDRSL